MTTTWMAPVEKDTPYELTIRTDYSKQTYRVIVPAGYVPWAIANQMALDRHGEVYEFVKICEEGKNG